MRPERLWFDVEKERLTILVQSPAITLRLWFDVEKERLTISTRGAHQSRDCGLM